MGLFDVEGFGKKEADTEINKSPEIDVFVENSFDKSIVNDVNTLIKVEVINSKYNMGQLLENLGLDIHGSNMYCPFHPDSLTGKPSAKYHEDTDLVYCFSENKMFSAYHALKYLYNADIESIFRGIWRDMSLEDRQSLIDRYENDDNSNMPSKSIPEIWLKYKEPVLDKFSQGLVSFRQHKNALYKILKMINEKEGI